MLREHDTVTVKVDVPQERLGDGDVGAVVHVYPERDADE